MVGFLRFYIEGTNENKLNAIKNWFLTKVDNNDLWRLIGQGSSISVQPDIDGNYFIFNCDIYLKRSVNPNKYKYYIVNQWQSLNKSGLNNAYVGIVYDCSHDEENPQPCNMIKVLTWQS